MDITRREALRRVLIGGTALATGLGLSGCGDSSSSAQSENDLIVLNAKIFTSNTNYPWAETLAVKNGRLIYVGDTETPKALNITAKKYLNAEGRTIIPGFVDNHCHVVWMGAMAGIMNMEPFQAQSLEDLKKMMTRYASAHPELPFIIGLGWTYSYIPGGMPTKEMADEILSDRPLVLWSSGGQTGWVNTQMLRRMMEKNPQAYQSLIPRLDANNQPTGVFMNFVSFNFLDFFTEEELTADIYAGMAAGAKQILAEGISRGVTTYNDIQLYKTFLPFLIQYSEEGLFKNLRLRGSYYVSQVSLKDEAQLKQDLTEWISYSVYNSEQLKLGDSVKLYIDGVGGSHTAFLLEPYADKPDEYGTPFWTQEDFNKVCRLIDGMGLQLCTHANGGAGQRRIINSYEQVSYQNSAWDARHRIEHCELPHPDDWARMGDLGIHGAVQPSHVFDVSQEYVDLYGIERVQRFMPWKSMVDNGVPLSFGSDWSAAPVNPLPGLFMAKYRLTLMGKPWGTNDDSLDMDQAVRAYTLGSAIDLKMEAEIGSLEIGKCADFVILKEDIFADNWPTWFDPTTFDPFTDFNDKIFLTVFNGEAVFEEETT